MKKLIKVIVVLVALAVVLLIAGSIALRIYLPPEKAKALVLHRLSDQLKRQVSLGSASVGILSGLQMADLKISESPDFSKGVFLSSEKFSLKVALFPLVFRKIIVRQIVLTQPEVKIVRMADGKTFNFSDLTSNTAPAAPPAAAAADGKSEALPFLLLVSKAQIQNGALHFIDRSPARQSVDIEPFDLILKNVSLTDPFSIQTSLHLKSKGNDVALSLAGQANLLDGTFVLKQGSLTSRQSKVTLSGEINRLKTAAPAVDLKVDIPQLNLSDISAFVALPPTIKIDKPLKGQVSVKGDQKTIDIDSQVSLGSLHVDGRGRVQNATSNEPYIAFHLETNAFPIAEVLAYAPTMVPPDVSLKGATQVAADISGTAKAVEFRAKWVATDLSISQGEAFSKPAGIPLEVQMAGAVTSMEPLKAVVNTMVLQLGTNELTGSGTYEVHGKQAVVSATVKAVRWSFPELTTVSPLLAPYHPTGTLSFEAHASGPVNAPQIILQTSGDLAIATVKQDYYEGHDLLMKWALTDVTPDLARANGTASLKQGPGKILNLTKLAASSQVGKIVLGPLDSLAQLEQKPPLSQFNLPNFQTLAFDSIVGAYQLHAGVMTVQTFDLNGKDLSLSNQGTVGLTGERILAMKVIMKFAPGIIGGTTGDLLEKDDKGRTLLKFTLSGPMANAKPKLDIQDMEKKAAQQAGQEILKSPKVQDAVNNLLKGILH